MNKKLFILLSLFCILATIQAKNLEQNDYFSDNEVEKDDGETCYGIIFDAGSSSTKLNIFDWPCRKKDTVPKINPQKTFKPKKAEKGIATFADKIDKIKNYLTPLINYANTIIPKAAKSRSPIMLFATAGMRVIPKKDQDNILKEVSKIFKESGYLFEDQWAKVISGGEEGAFLWISINYLLDNIQDGEISGASDKKTVATIDLGGASTQLSFEPIGKILKEFDGKINFPKYNEYEVYTNSYLGYGNDMVRNAIIEEDGEWSEDKKSVKSACFYSGYEDKWEKDDSVTIIGTGNPELCQEQIKKQFHTEECTVLYKVLGCGINGTYQPLIPSDGEIYALSGVTFATQYVHLDEQASFQPKVLSSKFNDFCKKSWKDIKKEYPQNTQIYKACFLGLYSSSLLMEGYNINPDAEVRSPSKIQGVSPSWTLGAMFYTVAQIPCKVSSPLCHSVKGIKDMLQMEIHIQE